MFICTYIETFVYVNKQIDKKNTVHSLQWQLKPQARLQFLTSFYVSFSSHKYIPSIILGLTKKPFNIICRSRTTSDSCNELALFLRPLTTPFLLFLPQKQDLETQHILPLPWTKTPVHWQPLVISLSHTQKHCCNNTHR